MKRHTILTALLTTSIGFSNLFAANPNSEPVFPTHLRTSDLGVWGAVEETGSDSRSEDFNTDYLPGVNAILSSFIASGREFEERSQFRLDQDKLYLTDPTQYPIRAYFIGEGAGYRNSLGLAMNLAGSNEPGEMKLIFPNASMPVSGVNYQNANFGDRTVNEPLLPGDFCDIGNFDAGYQLDFFIIQDGARGGLRNVYTNRDQQNSDQTQHVISFIIPDSPFLVIGFEDLTGGGDLDFEDVVVVVDIGLINARNLLEITDLPN